MLFQILEVSFIKYACVFLCIVRILIGTLLQSSCEYGWNDPAHRMPAAVYPRCFMTQSRMHRCGHAMGMRLDTLGRV